MQVGKGRMEDAAPSQRVSSHTPKRACQPIRTQPSTAVGLSVGSGGRAHAREGQCGENARRKANTLPPFRIKKSAKERDREKELTSAAKPGVVPRAPCELAVLLASTAGDRSDSRDCESRGV